MPVSKLTLTSSAFAPFQPIPSKYTCQGANVSPPLTWSGAPAGTKSFALIEDDPDAPDPAAPTRTWVHWVLSDIPASSAGLPENAAISGLPPGTQTGRNDFGNAGYGGPCPPVGRHRYVHELYALDSVLGLTAPTKVELERAMQGHVLGRAELVGTYQKRP